MKTGLKMVLLFIGIFIGVAIIFCISFTSRAAFNGLHAYSFLKHQIRLGPRTPGSKSHQEILSWLTENLINFGWSVETQSFSAGKDEGTNLIAKRGSGSPLIIIGAHYDSRLRADMDPDPNNRYSPVPGANDGASGVAVLLELARTLPEDINKNIWLVFFDLEDQGGIENRKWILGSQAFVDQLTNYPDKVIIIDMIGDKDLNIYHEKNSNKQLNDEIWGIANNSGFGKYFINESKYTILDDHIPFLEKGIPAINIIDFNYPYFHTTEDTLDKTSPMSLRVIGVTLINWLLR